MHGDTIRSRFFAYGSLIVKFAPTICLACADAKTTARFTHRSISGVGGHGGECVQLRLGGRQHTLRS